MWKCGGQVHRNRAELLPGKLGIKGTMDSSFSGRSARSSSARACHDGFDGDVASVDSSVAHVSRLRSCCPQLERTRDLCFDWRSLFWKRRPLKILLLANTLVFAAVVCSGILIYETASHEVRRYRHGTAIFPLIITNAVAFAAACKFEGSVALANYLGFVAEHLYIVGRDGYDVVDIKFFYIMVLSFVGLLEVQVAAHLVRIKLCSSLNSVPIVDTVKDALWYFTIVFIISLFFETLMAVVNCTTGLLSWSYFGRFWSTWWVSVLAAYLTISPALIHILDYSPRYTTILRPGKILECILLVGSTVCVLGLIIFSVPLTTVIRPLPYLLYPVVVFSVFRFNRLGWTVVLACICYFCSWGTMHYRSSALYVISGSPDLSSPELLLQMEVFMSVLGVVTISLAAAVREKKHLTKDLHNMNQKLEDAVRKRTQELTKANEELQVSQANAEKANHAKSEFLANMSHEIRTPILGILGLTDLLFQSELSPDQLESMVSVKDCADLLLHIINNILDLAKIEAGRLEIECVPFKIHDVVRTSLRMLEDRAKERGILLLWRVDEGVPPLVAGDPGKLEQCLLNLVGNALKFTHQGSVIVSIRPFSPSSEPAVHSATPLQSNVLDEPSNMLSTNSSLRSWASWPSSDTKVDINVKTGNVIGLQQKTSLDDAYLSSLRSRETALVLARDSVSQNSGLSHTHERILFEVQDTGIGIRKEIVQEMFNPFTQADASTSRLYGGTGLGLCIVQRFVELLKGKIWVESEIGKGSTFCFVIPFQTLSASEIAGGGVLLYPPYLETLKPLNKTLSLTTPRIQKRGSGRRLFLCRSLDSSNFSDYITDEQRKPSVCELSADSLDTKKRTVEAREELGPRTTKECSFTERHKKLHKGAVNWTFSDNFTLITQEGSVGEDSHIPPVSNCNRCVDFTCDLDLVELRQSSGEEVKNVGLEGEISTSRSKLHNSPVVGSASWDVEQGLVETKNPKPDLVELVIDPSEVSGSCSKPHKIEDASKADSVRREHSIEMSKLLPRKDNLHILLAEDNLVNQKVASRQLMRHGHTVTIVGDGLQALETLRRDHDKFDLVLMDIQMPNMDGLTATSILREEEAIHKRRRLPILGLTAHAMSGYQEICCSHGMDAYLDKPFQIHNLLNMIQHLTKV